MSDHGAAAPATAGATAALVGSGDAPAGREPRTADAARAALAGFWERCSSGEGTACTRMMARVRKQLDLPTGSIGCGQLPGGDTGTSPAEEMKIKVMRDRVAEILQSKPIVVASTATFTLPESFYGTIVFEPRRGLNDRQAPS